MAGSTFGFTVMALDAYNNTATGYSGTVAFTSTDGKASLPASSTLTNGVGSFNAALKTAGGQTITATDAGSSSITGTSNTITVSAAALSMFLITSPASTTAGASFSITVTATDAYGNRVTNYLGTVQFTSSDGAATLPGDYPFTSGDAGAHTFPNMVILKTAGNQTITATDKGNSSDTGMGTVLVNAAAAATFTLAGYPSPTVAGAAHPITLTVKDAYGNLATGYTGTVHFTSSDGQAGLPANYTFNGSEGVHTFNVTLKTAGTQSVTVTDTGNSSLQATQGGIVVLAAAQSTFLVVAPPSTVAGLSFGITVTATDAYGNTVSGYTGTVNFTSSDPLATLPGSYPFQSSDAGTHSFPGSVILNTVGVQTITATDSQQPTDAGSASVSVVGNHFAFVVSGSPVATGYTAVLPTMVYTPGNGFGWTTAAQGFDRGGPTTLLRAANYGTDDTFLIDHPNGTYVVSVTMGDEQFAHAGMNVMVGNTTVLSNLSSPAGQFIENTFTATITNGQLAIRFVGGNPYWVVNAIDLYPAPTHVLNISGPGGADVADGVTQDTFTGSGATPGAILTITTTLGTITSADASAPYYGIQVQADSSGNFSFTVQRPTGGTFTTVTAQDVTGAASGSTVRYFLLPTQRDFAFGSPSSPAVPGYMSINQSQLYSVSTSLGWAAPVGGVEYSGPTTLLRSEDYTTNGSFLVDLPVGTNVVSVTMGDAQFPRDDMNVLVGNTVVLSNLNTAAGQFINRSFTVTVTGTVNGQLALHLVDGGGDPYTVINALDIRPASTYGTITLTGSGTVTADGSSLTTITGHSSLPAGSLVTVTTSIGTIITADADPNYAGTQVLTAADGSFTFTIQSSYASGTPTLTADSVVTATLGAATSGPVSDPTVLTYLPAVARRFNFISAGAPAATGFISVLDSDTAVASLGYGWNNVVSQFDRGTASEATVNLYRDGNYGTNNTFIVQVKTGVQYTVRTYIGDPSQALSNIEVLLNGTQEYTIASVAAGSANVQTFTFTVAGSPGGFTTIQIGFQGNYWEANGLDIFEGAAGGPNDPGAAPQLAAALMPSGNAPVLTQAELAPVVQEALAQWAAAGLSSQQMAILAAVQYQIKDLSGTGALGLTALGAPVVTLDDTGAGLGWFLDASPASNSAFGTSVGLFEGDAVAGSLAAGRYDLLTVVEHELGHVLGLDDLNPQSAPNVLMTQTLEPGVRRLPVAFASVAGASSAEQPPLPTSSWGIDLANLSGGEVTVRPTTALSGPGDAQVTINLGTTPAALQPPDPGLDSNLAIPGSADAPTNPAGPLSSVADLGTPLDTNQTQDPATLPGVWLTDAGITANPDTLPGETVSPTNREPLTAVDPFADSTAGEGWLLPLLESKQNAAPGLDALAEQGVEFSQLSPPLNDDDLARVDGVFAAWADRANPEYGNALPATLARTGATGEEGAGESNGGMNEA
jgi:fibronectin type 3 domain-containing protein